MKTTISVQDNGPLQIKGTFDLIDANGNKFATEQDISLCRCGKSENKPFCDATHEEIHFESAPRAEKVMVEM